MMGRFSSSLRPVRLFFRTATWPKVMRANLADRLVGNNAYFNRIAIIRISMRFISPYPLFQTRRF
jgi:hypothetical protein